MPGPVEGKGEVNSPEMQVTESVLLARVEFFGSEAKVKGVWGKRFGKINCAFLVWGSFFEYYRRFKSRIEL